MADLAYTDDNWLGETPKNWPILPAKSLFSNPVERNYADDIHLTPSQKYGVLPQTEYMEVTGNRVVLNLSGADNMRHVEPGDFVSHLRSFQGGLEYSPFRGKVSSAYTVLRPRREIEPRFYKYLFKSGRYVQGLATTTEQLRDGQSIRYEQFALLRLPNPPLEEQKAIADFLDRELAQIDDLVARQESFMNLLAERSKALVRNAILLGLEPDRPTKRTSLTWAPTIPDDWKIKPLWMVLKFESGWTPPSGKDEYFEGDNLWANISDLGPRTLSNTQKFISDSAVNEFKLKSVKTGSLLFSFKLSIGQVSIAGVPMFTNEAIAAFQPNDSLDIDYMYYMLPITVPENASENIYGAKMLNAQRIKQARILIPPKDEQIRISKFLKQELADIEWLTKKAVETRDVLLEKRQALINASVTGKFDVRGKN